MATGDKTPVLDLSTIAPIRPVVRIDGDDYEVALSSDFGLVDNHRLEELRKPMAAYASGDSEDQETVEAMAAALKEFTGMVLRGSEPELLDKLTEGQRLAIIQVFTDTAGWQAPTPATPRQRNRRTPEKSSPGSNGSTEAATQSAG